MPIKERVVDFVLQIAKNHTQYQLERKIFLGDDFDEGIPVVEKEREIPFTNRLTLSPEPLA